MNGKCTDFPIAPVVQSDILGPQLDDVQRYCVVERVGALKGSEGSMQAPSSLQTDEHNHKDGGRNMYVNGSQAGEYRQVLFPFVRWHTQHRLAGWSSLSMMHVQIKCQ